MAEITVTFTLQVANGSYKETYQPGVISIEQAAVGRGGYVQTIGTSEEEVVFGDVATEGYALLRNLDATNFIEYGPHSGGSGGAMVAMGKLKAGEMAWLRLKPGITLYAQADTAPCKLDVRVYED